MPLFFSFFLGFLDAAPLFVWRIAARARWLSLALAGSRELAPIPTVAAKSGFSRRGIKMGGEYGAAKGTSVRFVGGGETVQMF